MASSYSSVGQKSHIVPVLSYLAVGTDASQNLQHRQVLKHYYYSVNFNSYMQTYKDILKT